MEGAAATAARAVSAEEQAVTVARAVMRGNTEMAAPAGPVGRVAQGAAAMTPKIRVGTVNRPPQVASEVAEA